MQRHIILTLGRSGSNVLVDMFNQHPEVLNMGEVLGPWTRFRRLRPLFRSEHAYLDFLLGNRVFRRVLNAVRSGRKRLGGKAGEAKRIGQIRSFGIKDFAFLFNANGLGDYLSSRPDIKVVGLIREDIFAKTISRANLRLRSVVALSDAPGQRTRVHKSAQITPEEEAAQAKAGDSGRLIVDPERFLEWLAAAEDEDAELRAMMAALPAEQVRQVSYEDLFSSEARRKALLSELFGFLGVPDRPTTVRMRKIITTPPNELIENFDACRRAASGTRFEHYFRQAET